MRHGFKSHAERLSCEIRSTLSLRPFSPLPGKQLVAHLKVSLLQPADIPGIPADMLHRVLNGSSELWSAITFYDSASRPYIIHNPNHPPARQESNLMHESAHILCKHPPAAIVPFGGFALREYNSAHEEEAAWLGGCLQIPREGLLWAIKRRMTDEAVALHFGSSIEMARYRRNVTGVENQLRWGTQSRVKRQTGRRN